MALTAQNTGRLARFALLISVLCSTQLLPAIARATDFGCDHGYVQITGGVASEWDLICKAAERTADLLNSMGIVPRNVEIEIVDQALPIHSEAVGCYDWEMDKVLLPRLERCSTPEVLARYGSIDADELTIGFVSHEIAHAAARHAFRFSDPSKTTQEYIAAVVQIGVIEQAERTRLLEALGGKGFEKVSEINLFAYQIDPAGFAVDAYRHFVRLGNGSAFIQALLIGEVVLKDNIPYSY